MPFLLPLTSVSIPRGLPSIPSLKFIFRSYVGYTTRSVSVYYFGDITVIFTQQDIHGRGRETRLLNAWFSGVARLIHTKSLRPCSAESAAFLIYGPCVSVSDYVVLTGRRCSPLRTPRRLIGKIAVLSPLFDYPMQKLVLAGSLARSLRRSPAFVGF